MGKSTDHIIFKYSFFFNGSGKAEHFTIRLQMPDLVLEFDESRPKPSWTRLEYNQCEGCPLKSSTHPYCPIALNMTDITPKFHDIKSYEPVRVRVETDDRVYEKETQLQHGLGSLLGIIMVSSGCPVMEILKPMVRFHLPFATVEETVFRSVSSYLIGQYFRNRQKKPADWDLEKLSHAYQKIQLVNMGMTDRIRSISSEDANANAVVVLDVFAKALPSSIFVELRELEYLFTRFLQE